MKTVLAAAALLAAAISTAPVQAASFNCSYAKLPAEVAICQYGDLSGYDEEMASLYYQAIHNNDDYNTKTIKREQKWFIKARNRCGYGYDCLRDIYVGRIGALQGWN